MDYIKNVIVQVQTKQNKVVKNSMTLSQDKCPAPVKPEVKILQRVLRRLGYFPVYAPDGSGRVKINGKFCYYTKKALTDFQKENKLSQTGSVTKETLEKLVEKACPVNEKAEKDKDKKDKDKKDKKTGGTADNPTKAGRNDNKKNK